MRFLRSIRILRVALALTVAFWMAGAGCLLGCENMVAAAAGGEGTHQSDLTIVASGDACAAKGSHDCCASKKKTVSQPSSAETTAGPATGATNELAPSSSRMMECPLAVNASAVLAKKNHSPSGTAVVSSASVSGSGFREQATALSPPLRLPNRGHTYLRCCVFLI